MLCQASLVDACSVKKELLSGPRNWSCVANLSSSQGFLSRIHVCVSKYASLHCASTCLASVWGKRAAGMTVPLCFYAILRISASSFWLAQKEVVLVPTSPQTSYSFQFCHSSEPLCISYWGKSPFVSKSSSFAILSFVLISSKQSASFIV